MAGDQIDRGPAAQLQMEQVFNCSRRFASMAIGRWRFGWNGPKQVHDRESPRNVRRPHPMLR